MLLMTMATAMAQVPVVVDVEWRVNRFAAHVSHGPAVGFGVGLLDDHLRVGVSGHFRPGPINPVTFTLTPDEPYNGQDTLELRSDGGVFGVYVAPGFAVSDTVRLDLPVMVGFGGYGFYLVGDDRNTPDGDLPSVWEDRLQDGRDSSLGLGADAGLRATFKAGEHVRPYVAVRYSTIFGYDAFLADDYSGVSLGVGMSVGRF